MDNVCYICGEPLSSRYVKFCKSCGDEVHRHHCSVRKAVAERMRQERQTCAVRRAVPSPNQPKDCTSKIANKRVVGDEWFRGERA